ncbi:LORF1 protein, partial [Crocuta crocuta]
NAITEMQSQMNAMMGRMDEAEQRMNDTEDKIIKNSEAEKRRDTEAKDHDTTLRELSDLLKRNNMCIIGILEDEERDKGAECLCEQNFPNLGKDTDIKIQAAQRTP